MLGPRIALELQGTGTREFSPPSSNSTQPLQQSESGNDVTEEVGQELHDLQHFRRVHFFTKVAQRPFPGSEEFSTTRISAEESPQVSGPRLYSYILCSMTLISKGVCKRNLARQHLFPDVFECEECLACFDVKADAKKHASKWKQGAKHTCLRRGKVRLTSGLAFALCLL